MIMYVSLCVRADGPMGGHRVVRMVARAREGLASAVAALSLTEQAKRSDVVPELRKWVRLKEEQGELSAPDEARYQALMRAAEQGILKVRRTPPAPEM
jgi:hypothetical protein